MKPKDYALLALALVLSGASIALHLIPGPQGPVTWHYEVKVYGQAQYRVFVLVNSQSVVADEFSGVKYYPLAVIVGDKIEVHGYSDQAFTVELWDGFVPVEQRTGDSISISFVVPEP